MELKSLPRRLRTRLTPPEYVSLSLLLGLVVSILCLWLLAHLVSEVIIEQEFATFDSAVAYGLHAAATLSATNFFLVITEFGFQGIFVIGLAVGLYFLWKRRWLRLGVWVAALAGGELLDLLLKTWFARPRPSFADPLAVALYYSFPSGHATMSLITYGFLAYLCFVSLKHAYLRVPITAALILLILVIGVSRIYLGVHYVTDVVAGFAVGGLWLSFCITAMNFLIKRRAWRARQT